MALIRQEYCNYCEHDTEHVNGECSVCADRLYRVATAEWNALSVEEKLQDIRKRLEKLEQGPPQY